MNPVFLLLLFIALLVLIEVFLGLIKKNPETQQAEKRLKKLTAQKYEVEDPEFVKKVKYSDIQSLNSFFSKFPMFHGLVRLLEQADVKQTLGYFILTSLVGVAVGFALTRINLLLGITVAVVLGILPSGYIFLKKKKRMSKFEKQLPDAMDLIARSLRAGLAFSAGLKSVSEEFPDPVGIEFGKTVSEINFGIATDEALKNLATRIDCPDLRFFVISVILQKETGGNLAEILESIARLVRERFKFQGKVRALSAEGRLSSVLLVAIPFFLAGLILILNPDYIRALKDEPIGNMMVVGALIMMIIGVVILKKMIRLKA
jgi:tight adherence protein B